MLGQTFTVLAVRAGGVSIHAPLMGTKVIFVAVFGTILTGSILPLTVWAGAGLAAIAGFLLGKSDKTSFHNAALAVSFALVSSLFFSLTDSMVAAKSSYFGRIPYLLLMMGTVCLFSLGLIPFFDRPFREFPHSAWRPAIIGGFACGVQTVILNIALVFCGRPTEMNIIYSARGIFGIALIWFAGHHFQNDERSLTSSAVMRSRLAGALLLCAAIALVFV